MLVFKYYTLLFYDITAFGIILFYSDILVLKYIDQNIEVV